jgi:molybdenum cofactor biosynthesis protein B
VSGHDAKRHGHARSAAVEQHHASAPRRIGCAVITVSDTRTPQTDSGGDLLAELLSGAGHAVVAREIVRDDAAQIRAAAERALANEACGAVLLTGGTGTSPRDVTPEAVRPLLERELPGFGELFRMLSFQEIGPAAMLSRAFAGARAGKALFGLPGSPAAIRLALERLVLPELGHLVGEATKRPGQHAAR